jgi:hypothetical protein
MGQRSKIAFKGVPKCLYRKGIILNKGAILNNGIVQCAATTYKIVYVLFKTRVGVFYQI